METYTDAKTLKDTLKRLKAFTDPKPHIPILEYIKLEANDGYLSLTAVSGERFGHEPSFTTFKGFTTYSPEYSILVRFKDFDKIAGKLKGDVDLSVSGDALHVKAGRLSFKLNGRDASDFPEWTTDGGEMCASSAPTYNDLRDELGFVSRATNEEMRNNFTNGVLFHYVEPDRLRLVATDGRRLHATYTATRLHSFGPDTKSWLVPTEWVEAFKRLNLKDNDDVFLEFHDDDQLHWRIPSQGIHGVVHCMDTPYPDYEKVIPDSRDSIFSLDTKPMLESLDALAIVASQRDGRDMVVINANGTINLRAQAESMGSAEAEVACTHVAGPERMFALNVFFLIETLKLANGEIVMSQNGGLEPAMFEYPGTERIAIVMPVRMPE
jgi:DNA polymerase-3 subunit beta